MYDDVASLLKAVQRAHHELFDKFNMFDNPEIILCAFYQDGLMHGLQRILTLRKTGNYSCRTRHTLKYEAYDKRQKEKIKSRKYGDVAYIEGYKSAFLFASCSGLPDLDTRPPLFFALGCDEDLYSLGDYRKAMRHIPGMHKAAYKFCLKEVAGLESLRDAGIVIHHVCQL